MVTSQHSRCIQESLVTQPEHGLGARVVKDLTEDLKDTHRHIYFDNYFSSVDLLLDLLRNWLSTTVEGSCNEGF